MPGGAFHSWLLLKKEGENYAKDARGKPILPIFKLAPGKPPEIKSGAPAFAADTPGSVWKGDKTTAGFPSSF